MINVGNILSKLWVNPFRATVNMAERGSLIGVLGAGELGLATVTEGIPGLVAKSLSFEGLTSWASIPLIFMNPAGSTIAAGLFALCALGGAFKGIKYLVNAFNSISKDDIAGAAANIAAAALNFASIIPIGGNLFKTSFDVLKRQIVQTAQRGLGAGATSLQTARAYTTSVAQHVYGDAQFAGHLGGAFDNVTSRAGWTNLGQGLAGRGRQGIDWVLAGRNYSMAA